MASRGKSCDPNLEDDNDDFSSCRDPGEEKKSTSTTMIAPGCLPSYLADVFAQLYEEDGLVVLGRGLGWLLLLATFVRFYADTEDGHAALLWEEQQSKKKPASSCSTCVRPKLKPPLVLVLGLNEVERKALVNILQSWGTPPGMLPTMITNEAGQGKDREALYARGGVFCITSRILIVDLLTNTAGANAIDGILVAHAETMTEQSTESFILRIFRSQKQRAPQQLSSSPGFVKAFTDAPERLLTGFAQVDKILKALRVRQFYLYPRFHDSIRHELEARPPIVSELQQSLSPAQKEIQHAIAAAVQVCIRELKQVKTSIQWDTADLSLENCVTAQFDRAISRQLEHDWHKLSPLTKQLVQDLRTLRTLFQALIHYDCVSFWRLINSIKAMSAASRNPSMWLLTPAGDHLFRKAKERVFRIHHPKPTANVPNPVGKLQAVLEENPKWRLLKQVLREVRTDYEKQQQEKAVEMEDDDDEEPTCALVMVKDEKTLTSVKSYLSEGDKEMLNLRWLRFLEQQNERTRVVTKGQDGLAAISEEGRLLLEEEGKIRRLLFGDGKNLQQRKSNKKRKALNHVPAYLRKRRRVATEKGRGDLTHGKDDLSREAVLDDALEVAEHELQKTSHIAEELGRSRELDEHNDEAMFSISHIRELRIVLKSYASIEGEQMLFLNDVRPRYVVFYDADVSFIRSVEIFSAISGDPKPLRAFFLMFEASAEEKNFMKALEKEQSSFERLIEHRRTMPPPMLDNDATQEIQQAGGSAGGTYLDGKLPLAFDSRKGQGKHDPKKRRRKIAVDVREFRAMLPAILHHGGMQLAPVTLTVGDYILSNVHCVERKSISDLFGSFSSGRLYTQAEAMCKFYKVPCLLIEFDPSKSFCLQSANDIGLDIRSDSPCSKITLLTMHFPKLRILWSRSPHETLEIFKLLKANHEEVDVEKAIEIGRNESIEAFLSPSKPRAITEDEEEDEINEAARDMLLRLPGVTLSSARRIMEEVDSLAQLADLSRAELRRIAGPITGQKLFTFFRQEMKSAAHNTSNK